MDKNDRIAELEAEIQDILKRWPAHSVKPELVNLLENLEEELTKLKR